MLGKAGLGEFVDVVLGVASREALRGVADALTTSFDFRCSLLPLRPLVGGVEGSPTVAHFKSIL